MLFFFMDGELRVHTHGTQDGSRMGKNERQDGRFLIEWKKRLIYKSRQSQLSVIVIGN